MDATRLPRGCQVCWIADNFQSPGAPPDALLYVHTSVTCCGVEGLGETMLPVIRSAIEFDQGKPHRDSCIFGILFTPCLGKISL